MPRPLLLLAPVVLLGLPGAARPDAFDLYTNDILEKVLPTARGVLQLKRLTPAQMIEHSRVLPGITATFLAVRTNDNRWARLLVQPARHRVEKDKSVPILLVERFTTFREAQERTVHAEGKNLRLFHDFRLSLDVGQVVPAELGGDLRFAVENDNPYLEPVGKAELYLITKPFPEAAPKKLAKLTVGAAFEPHYFNGTYKLYDDGRRSGELHLKVAENGEVTGYYYSDKDGTKYEVEGKVGSPKHAIFFKVTFPRTIQTFQGFMFTGDGRAITGSSRMQDRETGFYALRQQEK